MVGLWLWRQHDSVWNYAIFQWCGHGLKFSSWYLVFGPGLDFCLAILFLFFCTYNFNDKSPEIKRTENEKSNKIRYRLRHKWSRTERIVRQTSNVTCWHNRHAAIHEICVVGIYTENLNFWYTCVVFQNLYSKLRNHVWGMNSWVCKFTPPRTVRKMIGRKTLMCSPPPSAS